MTDDTMVERMPRVRHRRKYAGSLNATALRILIETREPAQVVQWVKNWMKAGRAGQLDMEIRLYESTYRTGDDHAR